MDTGQKLKPVKDGGMVGVADGYYAGSESMSMPKTTSLSAGRGPAVAALIYVCPYISPSQPFVCSSMNACVLLLYTVGAS